MLKQRKPLNPESKKHKAKRLATRKRERTFPQPATVKPLAHGTYAGTVRALAPVEKDRPVVSEPYRRLVRAMPCIRCGYPPPSQFCHTDLGKGMALKTDDRGGWPGCADRIGEPGCHTVVGRLLEREERRPTEADYARRTRAAVLNAGQWPKRLPRWEEGS